MDTTLITQATPKYIEAAILVLKLGMLGIIFSLIIGFFLSLILYYKFPVLCQLASFLVELSRNAPLLIILVFLFFGLTKVGVKLSSETAAILGLSFLGSGYMAETLRAGLESTGKTQIESAEAIGLSRVQVLCYILLPECLSVSIPPLCSNVIFLLKETSLFGVIGLADLVYEAKDFISQHGKTEEALLLLVVFYLVILLPILILSTALERRLRYAKFGN